MKALNRAFVIMSLSLSMSIFAERNLFVFDHFQVVPSLVSRLNVNQLKWVGTLVTCAYRFGFVKDLLGRIYRVQEGDLIGLNKARVVRIFKNNIVLVEDSRYILMTEMDNF